ncbi:hypothetical protein F4780DRAFT_20983 [Xylariomycetidae sp. FL0641]|nr:hypothetical protein F4780DRAFT_20983 [Xylariomycetidae sp. FL0641]
MSSNGPHGGFSLFPSTNTTKPPSRKTTPRPRPGTPPSSYARGPSIEMTPPQNGRHTPEDASQFIIDGSPPQATGHQLGSNNPYSQVEAGPSVSRPVPASEVPPRTDTAFSGASTLVRSSSGRSRSSIAKRPLDETSASPPQAGPAIRSIFPQYDHTLPFDRQDYFPTQTSPRHIPKENISRQSHVPQNVPIDNRSPPIRSPVRSPLSAGSAQRWPIRQNEPPVIPPVSTTEELRDFWKAANGWKASASEGRTFCMKLLPEKDTPIYNLTSRTQPMYHMRIDPTSASAYVTLSRHDPSRPCRDADPHASSPRGSTGLLGALRDADGKAWQEALTTTLEAPSRRQRPNDGLVALLYPAAAARVALERPGDGAAVAAAERECARLVWDDDSANYFLAHPALASPFCVTVERCPAYSRTEYAVEHVESPRPLARLARAHGPTGDGWLELDSLVAGRVDAYYVLDVAVAALLLVAHLDEKNVLVEPFAPPPAARVRGDSRSSHHSSSRRSAGSRLSSRILGGASSPGGKAGKKEGGGGGGRRRLEELELDLESQASSLGGKLEVKDRERDALPGPARTAFKLLALAFKCVIWALTLVFKATMKVLVGLTRCLTSEKL